MSIDSNAAEYAFIWTIKSCSSNIKEHRSSFHTLQKTNIFWKNANWHLQLNTPGRSEEDKNFISIYLHRNDDFGNTIKLTIDFTIILLAADASLNVSKRATSRSFSVGTCFGFDKFIRVDTILANKKIYLPEDTIRFQCYMVQKIDIEDVKTVGDSKAVLLNNSHPADLTHDLLRIYLDEKFCDVKITTVGRTFNVHKALMCARSPVFSAMFSSDTKENQSGIVDITDLDSDTVSRMLKFAYSNVAEVTNQDQSAKLYVAADKYEMLPLKERCSTLLKANLTEVNVYDTYTLADMHQDENLKAAAQHYIYVYAHKILKSSQWDKFMQLNSRLASEIMHKICLKQLDD